MNGLILLRCQANACHRQGLSHQPRHEVSNTDTKPRDVASQRLPIIEQSQTNRLVPA